jgi:hypothetical protein
MPIAAAAVVPHPPLLVPELGRGASSALDQLRSACLRAVSMTLARVDALLVAGPAPTWGEAAPGASGSFAPYGVAVTTHFPVPVDGAQGPPDRAPVRTDPVQAQTGTAQGPPVRAHPPHPAEDVQGRADPIRGEVPRGEVFATSGGDWLDRRALLPGRLTELPLSLAVAAWLLDQAAAHGLPPMAAFGVPASMPVERAAATGRALAGAVRPGLRVGLLVMGDLSARRTARAPATFHPAAEEFDRQIADAIHKADLRQLLDADASLAAELRVGGMAALWLLAGALEEAREPRTEVLYEGAPFGVGYLVGVIEPR